MYTQTPGLAGSCAALYTQSVSSASLLPHMQPDLQLCHCFSSNVSSSHVAVRCTAIVSLLASAVSGLALLLESPNGVAMRHLPSEIPLAPHVCNHNVPGDCSAQPDRSYRLPASTDLATHHVVDMLLQAQQQHAERVFVFFMAMREAQLEVVVKLAGALSFCQSFGSTIRTWPRS